MTTVHDLPFIPNVIVHIALSDLARLSAEFTEERIRGE